MRELVLGLTLGLGAGVAPGPLLGLLLATALRDGFPAGLRVALVPLVSDAPIVVLCVTVLDAAPSVVVHVFALAGGCFVAWLGLVGFRDARTAEIAPAGDGAAMAAPVAEAWRRGVLVNVLNPHPWLFWLGVGGPVLTTAWHAAPPLALAFLLGFYGVLVGSKAALAYGIATGRGRLSRQAYRRLLAGSAGLLVVAGVLLVTEAVSGL